MFKGLPGAGGVGAEGLLRGRAGGSVRKIYNKKRLGGHDVGVAGTQQPSPAAVALPDGRAGVRREFGKSILVGYVYIWKVCH